MEAFNPNQHIFQGFFGPQQAQIEQIKPEYIIHNEGVIEIINNWEHVINLINKYNSGKLKRVDHLEQDWFNFLTRNKINIVHYKNEDEFRTAFWRNP